MPTSARVGDVGAAEHLGQLADVAGADVPGPGLQRHDERQVLGPHPLGQQAHLRVAEQQRGQHAVGRARSPRRPRAGAAGVRRPGDAGRRRRRPAGPSTTFCGRTPSAPASGAGDRSPTATGPAPVSRPRAQPSGAASAALAAMRDHSAGISVRPLLHRAGGGVGGPQRRAAENARDEPCPTAASRSERGEPPTAPIAAAKSPPRGRPRAVVLSSATRSTTSSASPEGRPRVK